MSTSDWSAGYVADVNYTVGYYAELNPLRSRLALINQGVRPPNISVACELGFGQGLSVAVHAAASTVEWWGTDFNPAQAAFARSLDAASGAGSRLFDEAFDEFARRGDLPEFDFIALHGIWSWISDANREVIVDLIRHRLRPGGLVYVSYNAFPGWAPFVPVRQMLAEHVALAGEATAKAERIDQALQFAERLVSLNPAYMRANPQIAERLKSMKGQDRRYLAHEFFNRDWHPMSFDRVAGLLGPAKLSYAGSAYLLDHVPALNLTSEQQALLAEIRDPVFLQVVQDMMVSQQFRRDYWIKGPTRLTALEQSELLLDERIVLSMPRDRVSLKVKGALGEGTLSEAVYNPILDALADGKPRTLREVATTVEPKGVTLAQVIEAAVVLSSGSTFAPAQPDAVVHEVRSRTERLNAFIRKAARSGAEIGFLASPVTGGAVGVGRFDQLFLTSFEGGHKDPSEMAQDTWALLSAQGQKIVKEGKTLEAAEENLAELRGQAAQFVGSTLPALQSLGVAPLAAATDKRR